MNVAYVSPVKVAVAEELTPGEARVAVVPGLVRRLAAQGYDVWVEPGAGARAGHTDEEYQAHGSTVSAAALDGADVVLSVRPLDAQTLRQLRPGTTLVSLLPAGPIDDYVLDVRDYGHTAYALDLVPRTSRAQSMDVLTSQAMVCGYRAAVVGAGLLKQFLPGAHTAFGEVPPASALVLGAGVAGLEAMATLRRFGARVRGYDVRPSSAEEIASVGAEYVDLGLPPLAGEAGYARVLPPDRALLQRELLAPHVAAADLLVTTAAVPGHPAPLLVTRAMVGRMRPGSVVVDLAAESGGNVEGVVAGQVVPIAGAKVWGGRDVASQLPGPASRMYAHNAVSLIEHLAAAGVEDDIVVACCLAREGVVVHPACLDALGGAAGLPVVELDEIVEFDESTSFSWPEEK